MAIEAAYGVYANVLQAGLATSNTSLQRIAATVVDAPIGPEDAYLVTGGYEEYKKVYGYDTIGAKSRVPLKNLLNSTAVYVVRAVGAGSKKAAAYIIKDGDTIYSNQSTVGTNGTFNIFKSFTTDGIKDADAYFTVTADSYTSENIANNTANKDEVLANIAAAFTKLFKDNGFADGEAFVLNNNPSNLLAYAKIVVTLPAYADITVGDKLSFEVKDKDNNSLVKVENATKVENSTAADFITAITTAATIASGYTLNGVADTNGIITLTIKPTNPGYTKNSIATLTGNTIDYSYELTDGKGLTENSTIVVRLPAAMDNDTPLSITGASSATEFTKADANVLAILMSTGVVPSNYTITLKVTGVDTGKPVIQLVDCTNIAAEGNLILTVNNGAEDVTYTATNTDLNSIIALLKEKLPAGTIVEIYSEKTLKVTMPAGDDTTIVSITLTDANANTANALISTSEYVAPNKSITVDQGYIKGKNATVTATGVNIALEDVIDDASGKNININKVLGEYSEASLNAIIYNTNQLEWIGLIGKTIKVSGGTYVEPELADILASWNKFYDQGTMPVIRLMPTVNKSDNVAVHKLIKEILAKRGVGLGILNKPAGYTSRNALLDYANSVLGINYYRCRLEGTNIKLTDDLTGVSAFYSSAGEVAYKIVQAGYQAAAGIDGGRGVCDSVEDVDVRYTQEDRNFLDPAGINLILNKGSLGNVIYGEATCQKSLLPLHDTHNVMIIDDIILQGKDTLEYSMFNFNSVATRTLAQKRLEGILDPLLKADVISEYKVILDITKENPVDVAKGKMVAKVMVRCYASIKWIELNVYALDSAISIELAEATAS